MKIENGYYWFNDTRRYGWEIIEINDSDITRIGIECNEYLNNINCYPACSFNSDNLIKIEKPT